MPPPAPPPQKKPPHLFLGDSADFFCNALEPASQELTESTEDVVEILQIVHEAI